MINKEYLKSLNPCKNRWKNYLEHYSDFNGSIIEFLELDKISFDDKKWVLFRENSLISEKIMREFALLCACRAVDNADINELSEYFNLVLLMFESGDNLKDTNEYHVARDAAWDVALNAALNADRDAAWDAAWDVALNAARDAAWDVAGDAAWDATRDVALNAAWDVAWDVALNAEEKIQLAILINLVEESKYKVGE